MRIIVQFSGGKDSQAALIHSVRKYGEDKIEAVFCDTGWEHPLTYQHINEVCALMNVKLTTIKSSKYDGFVDLARKKGRFPSSQRRFCTALLKIEPFIDYILRDVQDHCITIQGIRAAESEDRAAMLAECNYFKDYFVDYKKDKSGGGKASEAISHKRRSLLRKALRHKRASPSAPLECTRGDRLHTRCRSAA